MQIRIGMGVRVGVELRLVVLCQALMNRNFFLELNLGFLFF